MMLIAMLLAHSLHGLKWQGTGSGMNNTVISEIFGIDTNFEAAMTTDDSGRNAFVNEISDRLNARWDPAWNVVFAVGRADSDTILYGYAFRNQWMWYNGVPYPG